MQDQRALGDMLAKVTVRSVEDIYDAAVVMQAAAEDRGMRVAICDDISSKEPLTDADGTVINAEVFGWILDGDRWWEDHRLALNAPFPQSCRYESEPFWCNASGFYGHWHNEYLDKIDSTEYFAKTMNYRSAILIPVHLPFGQISANCFVPVDPELEDLSEPFAKHSEFFALLTRRFVAGYVSAKRTKRRIPSSCFLSKHEVVCLRWAAIGKTDSEIGEIISRSHATVRYHIHRAGEKLNSVNRAQSIFKAGQLGFLGASD